MAAGTTVTRPASLARPLFFDQSIDKKPCSQHARSLISMQSALDIDMRTVVAAAETEPGQPMDGAGPRPGISMKCSCMYGFRSYHLGRAGAWVKVAKIVTLQKAERLVRMMVSVR